MAKHQLSSIARKLFEENIACYYDEAKFCIITRSALSQELLDKYHLKKNHFSLRLQLPKDCHAYEYDFDEQSSTNNNNNNSSATNNPINNNNSSIDITTTSTNTTNEDILHNNYKNATEEKLTLISRQLLKKEGITTSLEHYADDILCITTDNELPHQIVNRYGLKYANCITVKQKFFYHTLNWNQDFKTRKIDQPREPLAVAFCSKCNKNIMVSALLLLCIQLNFFYCRREMNGLIVLKGEMPKMYKDVVNLSIPNV